MRKTWLLECYANAIHCWLSGMRYVICDFYLNRVLLNAFNCEVFFCLVGTQLPSKDFLLLEVEHPHPSISSAGNSTLDGKNMTLNCYQK